MSTAFGCALARARGFELADPARAYSARHGSRDDSAPPGAPRRSGDGPPLVTRPRLGCPAGLHDLKCLTPPRCGRRRRPGTRRRPSPRAGRARDAERERDPLPTTAFMRSQPRPATSSLATSIASAPLCDPLRSRAHPIGAVEEVGSEVRNRSLRTCQTHADADGPAHTSLRAWSATRETHLAACPVGRPPP